MTYLFLKLSLRLADDTVLSSSFILEIASYSESFPFIEIAEHTMIHQGFFQSTYTWKDSKKLMVVILDSTRLTQESHYNSMDADSFATTRLGPMNHFISANGETRTRNPWITNPVL